MTWLEVEALLADEPQRRFGRRVLDIRSDRRHLPGSANLPVASGQDWAEALPSHELCERSRPLVVVAETPQRAAEARDHLRARGWDADALGEEIPEHALVPGPAPGTLWRPDPYLESLADRLPPPSLGPVLDLGAGSGRDACFLAARGYDCLLLDRLEDALTLAHARAARIGVGVRTGLANLQFPEDLGQGYSVALSIRFLERAALRALTDAMAPGGVVILHTFGPSSHAGDPGRIRARFRLDPGELASIFPAPQWSVLDGPHLDTPRDEPWISAAVRREPQR